ncbi:hypothetical protein HMPREF9257_0190 [Eremococcus coleocola ACS-139-V-Col8]|uniref:Uncharacterized protein n=1 Tax=Eremococcus coleocola ACS-139-V-Col8 TaxID=908337 RepID=E4KMX7_9LACT|nr:hypothetical protein HMPREF9257_0190 [Eremococcus coleocola ACS-139-V-Col8]
MSSAALISCTVELIRMEQVVLWRSSIQSTTAIRNEDFENE